LSWLLDTDVICQPAKRRADARVVAWLLEKHGQRMPVEDGYIAATARRHGLTIATGNDKDFRRPGLKVFNPFKELPPV
jgi:predicted nucleic acid-binding protein